MPGLKLDIALSSEVVCVGATLLGGRTPLPYTTFGRCSPMSCTQAGPSSYKFVLRGLQSARSACTTAQKRPKKNLVPHSAEKHIPSIFGAHSPLSHAEGGTAFLLAGRE